MSNWAVPYQTKREQYWLEIERFFSTLPSSLFRQGLLLKNNLATFYAETGQFKDILSRNHDHPLLYLHFWLLDDWACSDSVVRAELEPRLLAAMTLTFAAVQTQALILDQSTNFDNNYLFLEQSLTQQADFHLTHLFPGSSPFWNYHHTFWQEYAEATLTPADVLSLTPDPQPPIPNPRLLAGKLAYTKISAAAVALSLNREDLWPPLCALLDQFNAVFQIMRDVSTLRRDLGQGNLTYPLLRTMAEAGLDPLQPVSPERILGALVLTGAMKKISQECLSQLSECRKMANALNLPTFMAYLEGIERWVAEIGELFSLKNKPAATSPARNSPIFVPYIDTLPKVIEMAEGYLLSDLTFRESWEVQRRGVFGAAEITGKAFPMGLIVEILSQHGHDMAAPVNDVFETLQATGWRYYDHPHLPSDTDDLGLLLRLYHFSAQPEHHRAMLQPPLDWLEDSVAKSGEIPVWLNSKNVVEATEPRLVALWGQSCATVEANMLLGLIDYDWDGYHQLIARAAARWCQRMLAEGLAATHHYVPLYSLWTAFSLIANLGHKPLPETLSNSLDQTGEKLAERLALEANRPHLSPQDVAFLILACLEQWSPKLALTSLLKPDWLTLLCKSQRYDGSWAAEPLYGTPTRGELAAWYSSRSVTTAFCYHALKRGSALT